MRDSVIKLFATFFGIGYLPFCPGTWASLATVVFYFLLRNTNDTIYLCVAAFICILGFFVCSPAEKLFGNKDSHFIVIDEVAAFLIVLYFVPYDLFYILGAFLIFRIMDITKPYPIKKIEKFSGSWGIMLDDLVAGIYTLFVVWLIFIVI